MRYGIWAPLPNTVRTEPMMQAGLDDMARRTSAGVDKGFQFAVDVVRKAEACGFDITLIAERHLGPDLEAWILSSAIAAQTQSIQIMTAVHPGIVNPQVVAKMGATLDRISGGRFAVNIVTGRFPEEFEVYGNGAWIEDADRRYRRMDEFVQVMKGLWIEDSYSLDGDFYKVASGQLPTKTCRAPCPPIYAASGTDPGKDIIARECDLWFVSYRPGYRFFAENFETIRADIADMKRRAAEHGRRLEFGASAHVVCADTTAEAESIAAEMEEYGRTNGRGAVVAAKGLGVGLVGTPARVAERIQDYAEIGLDLLMLHFHPMIDGIESFAREVMPRVAGADRAPLDLVTSAAGAGRPQSREA